MRALCISDLYLSDDRPEATSAFCEFLQAMPSTTDALYILGNLFEMWVGDDCLPVLPAAEAVAHALKSLTTAGVAVRLFTGNRDFLLGERFADACGASLYPETAVETINGTRIAMTHGDQLILSDTDYQAFRVQVRKQEWRKAFLARPLSERLSVAREMRRASKAHRTFDNREEARDIDSKAAAALVRAHRAQTLLHGHTNRPGTFSLSDEHGQLSRYVLGDWYGKPVALELDQRGIRLRDVDLRNSDQLAITTVDGTLRLLSVATDGTYRFVDDTHQAHNLLYATFAQSFGAFRAIEELEDLINGIRTKESDLQRFFEHNPDFLLSDEYRVAHPHICLDDSDGKRLIPDFMLEPVDQHGLCDLLELKLPGERIFTGPAARRRYSAAVLEAAAQLRHYRDFFDNPGNREKIRTRYGVSSYKPRMIVIIGRSETRDPILRRQIEVEHPSLQLRTYDEVLARMKARQAMIREGGRHHPRLIARSE